MGELDHLGSFLVLVVGIHGVIFDFFLRKLEVTDVAPSSSGMLFKEVGQILQLIIHVA